jgi:hypothetical protein
MRFLVAVFLFVVCTGQIVSKTKPVQPAPTNASYFIKADGNGNRTGLSPKQAWDLHKANNFSFQPGDTITIIGTVNGSLTLTESGTSDAMITIQGGKIFSDTSNGLCLYNNDHILVRNLALQGSGKALAGLTNSGVTLKADDQKRHAHIILDHIISKGYGHAGIYSSLGMQYPGGYDSLIISNCVADSNGYAGIDVSGSWPGRQNRNILIQHSSASHNRGINGMQPHSGHGIILSDVSGGIIDSCFATNNGWEYGSGNIGIWAYSAENVTIQNCVSFRNKSTTGLDGGGFDLDGGTWNCVMQYNLSYENDGAGYLMYEYGDPNSMKNNTCRYNISGNDARNGKDYGGITIGGVAPLYDIRIYNNTIVQDEGKTLTKVGMAVQGILEIRNNILSSPAATYVYQDLANNLVGNAGLPSEDFYKNGFNGKRGTGAVAR